MKKATKYLDGLKEPHKAKIYKTFNSEVKVADDIKRTLVVTISTPNADRSHDTMNMKGMQYDNFIKNPVVLFAHKYDSKPIAKCLSLQITTKAAIATVEFTPEGLYQEADIIYSMYKEGFLNAWSIGFMPKDYDYNEEGGYDFKMWELFEFSSVPVPDNPEALTIMRSKGINVDVLLGKKEEEENTEEEDIEEEEEVVEKGAIGFKETPKAPEDEAWDGSAEVKAASVEDLKAMCAWFDSDNADNKSAYKLPHHKAEGDHAVVWNGVKAAGGAVQGARNKLDVPEGDLAGIKKHLASHYAQFDKTPPWEDDGKAVDEETTETKALPEGDADNPKDPGYTEDTKITELTVKQLMDVMDRVLDAEEEEDENEEEKAATEIVKKDVQEVIALGYVLDTLSWFISCFEMNEVSQPSIDKLTQALGLVMQVVAEQAELGKKEFSFADFPNTKESVKILAKAGRAISSKHEGMLKDACGHMTKAMDNVQTVLDTVAQQEDDEKKIEPKETKEQETVIPETPTKEELLKKIVSSLKNNSQQQAALIKHEKETKSLTEKLLEEIRLKGGEK